MATRLRAPSPRWMSDAECVNHQDLPWTADFMPIPTEIEKMSSVCKQCPVIVQCASFALADSPTGGGFYAGVWLPWHGVGTRRDMHHGRTLLRRLTRAKL